MGRLVWAFEPLDELNGETGFVDLADEDLAARLVEAGKVQCGWAPEGGTLKHIDGGKVAAYGTRQLKAGEGAPRPAPDKRPERPPQREPEAKPPEDPAKPERPPAPASGDDAAKKRGRPPKQPTPGK
jgi:hypothetical protein